MKNCPHSSCIEQIPRTDNSSISLAHKRIPVNIKQSLPSVPIKPRLPSLRNLSTFTSSMPYKIVPAETFQKLQHLHRILKVQPLPTDRLIVVPTKVCQAYTFQGLLHLHRVFKVYLLPVDNPFVTSQKSCCVSPHIAQALQTCVKCKPFEASYAAIDHSDCNCCQQTKLASPRTSPLSSSTSSPKLYRSGSGRSLSKVFTLPSCTQSSTATAR